MWKGKYQMDIAPEDLNDNDDPEVCLLCVARPRTAFGSKWMKWKLADDADLGCGMPAAEVTEAMAAIKTEMRARDHSE